MPDIDAFMATYSMACPMAARRLVHSGMPATMEHGLGAARPSGGGASAALSAAETTQHFITTMDALKLNLTAVDQVCPLLGDLVNSLNAVPNLPPDAGGKAKARAWFSKLHGMPASYELQEGEVRQLLFDLESAYNEFMTAIRGS